jgi:hypothetical protein
MKVRLIARIGQMERIEARAAEKALKVQIGHLKRLPADYEGERHVITLDRYTAETGRLDRYEFEERTGPAPIGSASERILRVCLV